MKARKTAILGLSILATVCLAPEAMAQQVNSKARDKVEYYHAPHELQLIDDRPHIRDFREAPSAPENIQLPPPPSGFGGPGGGGQGGAMGDGGGANPSGGIPLAGAPGMPAYRSDVPGMGSLPMEKAGFGNHTNIPAGGIHPNTPLQNGQTTGVHGSLMTPTAHSQTTPGQAAGPRGQMGPSRPQAPAASYAGNYTQPTGGGAVGGGGSTANVQGRLLNRLLKGGQ